MTKLKVLFAIMLLLAPLASGQLVYDSVRVKVASGTTCHEWVDGFDGINHHPDSLHRPGSRSSIGGAAFRVTSSFVNLMMPPSAA